MARLTFVITFVAAMFGAVSPASSQPEVLLLYGFVPGCFSNCGGTILRVAPDAPAVLSSSVDAAARNIVRPYVTPEGRFLVWATDVGSTGTTRLAVRDLIAGTTQTIAAPGSLESGNPARSELYLSDHGGIFALGPQASRRFGGAECANGFSLGTSSDGRRLFWMCFGTATLPPGTRVFDLDAGQAVAVLPPVVLAAPNHDGSMLYAVDQITTAPRLQRFDVATGALAAEAPIPASPASPAGTVYAVHVDAVRSRVLVVSGEAVQAFDPVSLQRLASSPLATGPALQESVESVSADDVGARLYSVRAGPVGATAPYSYSVLDMTSLQPTLTLPGVPSAQFVARSVPRPPAALTATVSGAAIQLSWSPGGAATSVTHYVLEAGSSSGARDLVTALDVGQRQSFAANGVPPGTYYVRVRAGNYAGLSAPSNEVVVRVP